MATITPTSQVNAATMAANWTKGVQGNSAKWLNKYLNPKSLFNANPAQAQQAWQAGVTAALAANSYQTGLAAADPAVAAANATTYGATNYANSGTAKAYKYQRKSAALAQAISTVAAQVNSMPKGKGANNINRMVAWANGMAAYKGKIGNS